MTKKEKLKIKLKVLETVQHETLDQLFKRAYGNALTHVVPKYNYL